MGEHVGVALRVNDGINEPGLAKHPTIELYKPNPIICDHVKHARVFISNERPLYQAAMLPRMNPVNRLVEELLRMILLGGVLNL